MKWYEDYNLCYEKVTRTVPKVLADNTDYQVFLKLIAYGIFKSYIKIEDLNFVYDADKLDASLLRRLADSIGIFYPMEMAEDEIRVILKYFNKIKSIRGTESSIKQLVRILNRTEQSIIDGGLAEYVDVEVEEYQEGCLIVRYDGITDFDFVREMLKFVTPVGYKLEVAHKDKGGIKFSSDVSNNVTEITSILK